VRRLRRLVDKKEERRREGVLVAEGPKVIAAALDVGAEIESVYAAPDADAGALTAAVLERARDVGISVYQLAPGVMAKVADASTPQPLIATVRTIPRGLEAAFDSEAVLVLVDVRDPGNLGALLRVADAAGVGAVIACAGSVDWQSPKAVRASTGSCFALRIVDGEQPDSAIGALRSHGYRTIATAIRGGIPHDEVDFRSKVALILGNEASGLSPQLEALVDEVVTVPMSGSTESLNVATAAAVVCYERVRQIKAARGGVVG
jgi:RNA methyltransferase, TrmH family